MKLVRFDFTRKTSARTELPIIFSNFERRKSFNFTEKKLEFLGRSFYQRIRRIEKKIREIAMAMKFDFLERNKIETNLEFTKVMMTL